jgi:hypothetical protein
MANVKQVSQTFERMLLLKTPGYYNNMSPFQGMMRGDEGKRRRRDEGKRGRGEEGKRGRRDEGTKGERDEGKTGHADTINNMSPFQGSIREGDAYPRFCQKQLISPRIFL